ncbi:MAG TPA: glycoside hydrolase family 31 protein [Ktedonobacterales bacterium]|nr:glycoside hydrolase family 31 protein [Ktedonobacterales bacterium]
MTEPSETTATPAPQPQPEQHGWERATIGARFSATAISDDTLRVAVARLDAPPHRTWSLAPSAAGLHPNTVALDDQGDSVSLDTGILNAGISLASDGQALQLHVTRSDGSVAIASATVSLSNAGNPVWMSILAASEHVYGGGERTGSLDRRGRSMTFWTTDPLPNHGEQTDAMYQSVPFLTGLVDGKAYGVYFDNNERAVADIGKARPDTLTYTPESADLVAYIFAGPTLGNVLREYTALTGRMPPLPRWAYGYQQSRWGYRTSDDVLKIAEQFRAQAIPCDAIYLDIDYMDGYRVFTWDAERFPDPADTIQKLREQHFRLVTIIDPGVKVDPDYSVYQEGLAKGYFARAADGTPFQGWVWPGRSCWGDFDQAAVGDWWGEQHRGLVEAGVAGIWNDMNEPSQAAIFAPPDVTLPHGATLPDDVRHGPVDDTITHAQFHNAYGLTMCQATRAGLERLRLDERPFVLTRAATAGSQRSAIVWNGDSTSSWENLRLAIPLNLGMGLSGFPMTGGDIGGFWNDVTAELLTRWTQLGALLPFCRNHSAVATAQQEPWAFGEPYTSHCRAALELRYRLLPHILTLAHEATLTGAPIVRPLAWVAPTHAASLACDDQFLLGNDLLVAPVLEEGATSRTIALPPGEWFTWDSAESHTGDQRLTIPVTLESLPLYVRAGTVLPLAAAAQSTGEMTSQPLTLHVYLAPTSSSATADIYLDDDHPQAERRGTFGRWHAEATWRDDEIAVTLSRAEGRLPWPYPACAITVHIPDEWTAESLDARDSLTGESFTVRYRVSPR